MGWLALPYVVLLSLLPARWRRPTLDDGAPLALATLATAIVEAIFGVALGVISYAQQISQAWTGPGAAPGGFGFGAASYLGFLFFTPLGLLSLGLLIEGAVRGAAGAIGEPCALAVPAAIDHLLVALGKRAAEKRLPPLVPDRVTKVRNGGIEIRSVRPRDWDELTTLEIEGAEYRVTHAEELAGSNQPWRYVLAPVPVGWLMRKRVEYSADDILSWRPGPYERRKTTAGPRLQGGR